MAAALAGALSLALAASASAGAHAGTRLYVPPPSHDAIAQIKDLVKNHEYKDAALVTTMVTTPQAVWVEGGTPRAARKQVATTMRAAARQHAVPVLVAYDLPFRDCSQYSAGGALSTDDYLAWINGVAQGIGNGRATVVLEPDGLGIIPFNTDLNGNAEWCQPKDADGNPQPGASPAERYRALNGAVDRLKMQPNVKVYLDGTHSAWLGVGEISDRLVRAGVQRADGFFLNVSNYQSTDRQQKYGTWISDCIAFANDAEEGGWRLGHYGYCASQYYPADPNDISTWGLSDAWYASNMGTATPTAHFIVDTSRNGRGPNDMSAYAAAPYNQPASVVSSLAGGSWCNPPGRGLGLRPTTATGVPLLDAYLWVKTPGESDGSCDIAGGARAWDYTVYNPWGVTGDAQNHFDPLWGRVDPAAGAWFPAQAVQLARLAVPSLLHR